MKASVKEFFNKKQRAEQIEEKLLKDRRWRGKSLWKKRYKDAGRKVGIRPFVSIDDIPKVTNLTHFLDCEISPSICPMQYEELEIDFQDNSKRYCKYCEKYVYKVDNEFMLNKYTSEDKCIAITTELFEKINGKQSKDKYDNLENRLKLSRFYIELKREKPNFWEELIDQNLSSEDLLKKSIQEILDNRDFNTIEETIDSYIQKGIDMKFIFEKILINISDDEFQN